MPHKTQIPGTPRSDSSLAKEDNLCSSAENVERDNVGQNRLFSLSESPTVPEKSYELRVFQSLRRIIRAIEIHSRRLANDYGITGPQLLCLAALREEAPLTIKKLAQSAYLSASTVVGIVDRLEEKDLVTRIRSVSDRRAVQISITGKGRTLLASAPSPIQESLAQALEGLPEKEKISIALAMEKVVDLMEASGIDAAPVLETGNLTDTHDKTP
jgi:DNA-binding MarR family transcriptional regulator